MVDLAARLQVSKVYVFQMVYGKAPVNPDILPAIIRACHVPEGMLADFYCRGVEAGSHEALRRWVKISHAKLSPLQFLDLLKCSLLNQISDVEH